MGETAILNVREVCGVLYFGLYMGPTGVFLRKTLFDLVNHARAGIYSHNGYFSLNGCVIGREKSRDVSAATATDVDDSFRLGEGEGSVGGS